MFKSLHVPAQAPWPLPLVITHCCLEQYNRLFKLLLAFRHVHLELQHVELPRMELLGCALRAQLAYFVSQVLQYFQQDVIEPAHRRLLEALDGIASPIAVLAPLGLAARSLEDRGEAERAEGGLPGGRGWGSVGRSIGRTVGRPSGREGRAGQHVKVCLASWKCAGWGIEGEVWARCGPPMAPQALQVTVVDECWGSVSVGFYRTGTGQGVVNKRASGSELASSEAPYNHHPVALWSIVHRSDPREAWTPWNPENQLRRIALVDCATVGPKPCQGWPLHTDESVLGMDSGENGCNLPSANRRRACHGNRVSKGSDL